MQKAKCWMANGKIIVQTDTHQYQVTATMLDLMTIRSGGPAEVELEIIERKIKEAPASGA